VRVATLNLWGRHGDWSARREVLAAGLRALSPDLVALQEAIVAGGYDQVADVLGAGYEVAHGPGRTADGSGASIASRWPIGRLQTADLHVTPRVDPAAGWIGSVAVAEIHVPEPVGPMLFVHHKPSWQWGHEHERELQAVASARLVEDVLDGRALHVVLAGDFDAPPDAASMRFWRGRQSLDGVSVCYADAWESVHRDDPGHTFTPLNPLVAGGEMPLERGRRIDYVLVRCADHGPTLAIGSCSRIFTEPAAGVWASDHFGVVADLDPPPR
jgi:endonuclease/exonuclease/phosphatase family metal-dependent hydrolase